MASLPHLTPHRTVWLWCRDLGAILFSVHLQTAGPNLVQPPSSADHCGRAAVPCGLGLTRALCACPSCCLLLGPGLGGSACPQVKHLTLGSVLLLTLAWRGSLSFTVKCGSGKLLTSRAVGGATGGGQAGPCVRKPPRPWLPAPPGGGWPAVPVTCWALRVAHLTFINAQ